MNRIRVNKYLLGSIFVIMRRLAIVAILFSG